MSTAPQSPPDGFREQPPWPKPRRTLAIALWSGFLGAALMLLGLLMCWEHLFPLVNELAWTSLAILFLLGWLVCIFTALVAQVLSRPPGAHYQPLMIDDENEH